MGVVLRVLGGLLAAILSVAGVALGLVVAVVTAAYFYVQTEGGRRALADTVAGLLSGPGAEVTIGGIGAGLPSRLAVRDLVMRDGEGAWLEVDEAIVTWAPMALFDRLIHVTDVNADGIRLARLPPASEQPDEEPTTDEVAIPSLPVDVRVDRIDVRDLELGEPIVGEAMTLAITGQVSAPAQSAVRTDLEVVRTDRAGLRATVSAGYDPQTDVLTLDVDVSEPKDGLIARLAGLAPYPPVALHLEGEGPLGEWRGQLTASAGDLIDADLKLAIAREDGLRLSVAGRADVAGLVEPPVRALVEDVVVLDVVVAQVSETVYGIERLRLLSDAIEATGEGRIDLDEQTVAASVAVNSRNESRLAPLLGGVSVGEVGIRVTADGALTLPDVVLEATVQRFAMPEVVAAETVTVEARVRRRAGADADAIVLAFDAEILGSGVDAMEPALAGLTGEALKVGAEGTVNLATMVVDLSEASVVSGPTRLSAKGEMNLESGDIDAALETAIGDLSGLSQALGQPLEGALKLNAKAAGNVETLELTGGTIDGAVTGFSMGDPAIDEVVGDRITLAADYTVHGGERATIDARINAGEALRLTVEGRLSDGLQTLLASYRLEAERLAVIGEAFDVPIAGSLTLSGTAEGDPADPSVVATATLTDARYEDFQVEQAVLDVSGRTLVDAPAGTISLTAKTQAGPVDVKAAFAMPQPELLRVETLAATLPGLSLDGEASVSLETTTVNGRLQGTLAAANGVEILGTRIEGEGGLDIRLQTTAGRQQVVVDVKAGPLAVASGGEEVVRARSIALQGRVEDALGTPRIEAQLDAKAIGSGEMVAESVEATVDGPLSGAQFRVAVGGFGEPPLEVTTAGNLGLVGEEVRVALSQLQGSYGEIPFSLRRDASIVYAPSGITIGDLAMSVSTGEVTADGVIGGARTAATVRISQLPASLAAMAAPGLTLQGTLGAEARLRAEGGLIGGTVQVTVDGLVQEKGGIRAAPPVDAVLDVTLRNGTADAEGRISGIGTSPLTLSARMPLAIDAQSLGLRSRQTTPIQASVQWQGDVAPLMQVAPVADQRLAGQGRIDVRVSGTLESPVASGEIAVRNGTYEHLIYGTLIKNLSLAAEVDSGQRIRLSLSGTDGGSGSISADGQADLADLEGEPITLGLRINDMTLVRRDDITASASGQLDYDGTPTSGLLEGRIETNNVEVRLVDQLPPSVVDLEVIEIRGDESPEQVAYSGEGGASEEGADTEQTEQEAIRLDLTLSLPNRVFVGGRGLESEWSGTLTVRGTASDPRVVGSITAIRGTFDFAGRQFDLAKSSITFDGGRRINPRLDIRAQYQGDQFTAIVSVTGTPSNPELTLSSNPALPQSEILPQVLFGKSSSQLSPGEAVEIALALDTIARGGGLSENVLGKLRNTLGLANLSLGTDAEGDPTVKAGRYIGERVYVETVQGARPGTSKYRAEVELTDQLSLEAETGDPSEDTGEYLGLKWQYDY